MTKRNYSKYSEKSNNEVETTVEPEVETEVEPEVETEETEGGSVVVGTVAGCAKLNVRGEANKDSEVVCIINEKEEVQVDLDNSTVDFYAVTTKAGVTGYCMKKFIAIV